MKRKLNNRLIWARILVLGLGAAVCSGGLTMAAQSQNTAQTVAENRFKPELVIQTGHAESVSSVRFSPDGKTVASGSLDNTIKLWRVGTGQELRSLQGHDSRVFSIAFSPDGKILASGSEDKTIKIWNIESGTLIRTLADHDLPVLSLAFSPDGMTIVSGSADNTIKLWSVESGQQIKFGDQIKPEEDAYPAASVCFSPDGKTIASSELTGNTIKLWNAESGEEMKSFEGNDYGVMSVAFSPDGKTLASGGKDNAIKLFNVDTEKEIKSFEGHTGRVNSVAFSPDGKKLVSASDDYTIKIWNIETEQQIKSFEGHSNSVFSVAFSPDGKTLASGGEDKTIKIWNIESGRQIKSLEGKTNSVWSAAFSPNGKLLATSGQHKTIKIWSIETGQQIKSLEGHTDLLSSVAFSPDSKKLVSSSDDRTIKIWNVETGQQIMSLEDRLTYSVAFLFDGKTIALNGAKGIEIWNIETRQQIKSLEVQNTTTSIAFSPDGKTLISGGGHWFDNPGDFTVKIWNTETGQQIKSLAGHTDMIYSVAFSPDCKFIVSSSRDNTIKLWKVETGELVRTLTGHADSVRSVAFSPDGKKFISGGEDNTIKIWNIESGQQIKSLEGHTSSVRSVAFSPDGKFFISGSSDATITVWDSQSDKLLVKLISLDNDDWIVVTTDGYFDGTPNAWKLLLWRLSPQLFDVVPVEAFFSDFFRPELLADIFSGKAIKKSPRDIASIDIRQPVVKIELTKQNTKITGNIARKAAVSITVIDILANQRSPNSTSGAQDLRLFRNGSLVKVWHNDVFSRVSGCKPVQTKQGEPRRVRCSTEILIVAGENNLTAYAFNSANVKSNDSTAQIAGKFPRRDGTLYVLAVGVNKYANSDYNLNFAVPDVVDIGNAIKQEQSKIAQDATLKQYAEIKVITLKDEAATRDNILLALNRFARNETAKSSTNNTEKSLPENLCAKLSKSLCAELATELAKIKPTEPEDALVVYYAGHGVSRDERFYLLPHNFTNASEKSLSEQGVSDLELNDYLERVDAGRLLMAIDACQSGGALGAKDAGRAPMNSKGLAQLAYDKGMYILTAAQSQEAALEAVNIGGKEIRHGLLTYALLEGLKNSAADKDANKQLWEREWLDYAVSEVPLMQREAMKRHDIESKKTGRDIGIVYLNGDNRKARPEDRAVQTPRVFYKREVSTNPFVITKP